MTAEGGPEGPPYIRLASRRIECHNDHSWFVLIGGGERHHASSNQSHAREPRRHSCHARPREAGSSSGLRQQAARPRPHARVADQRLCLLSRHAQQGCARNGETEQRLYGLNAWRETPYYSARERAALEWTEALTLVSETHVPDDVYERVREQFSEDELAHLSLAVVAINGWNRLNVAARTVPGDYVPGSLDDGARDGLSW